MRPRPQPHQPLPRRQALEPWAAVEYVLQVLPRVAVEEAVLQPVHAPELLVGVVRA